MRREYCDPGDQAQKIRWRISRWKNSFLTPEQALIIAKDDDEGELPTETQEGFNDAAATGATTGAGFGLTVAGFFEVSPDAEGADG